MAAEFSRRTESLLDRADLVCRQRGANLTELRRHILGLVLDAASPTGAYKLLDRLRQTRRGAAPPTVYRTLDFLVDQGLIHKVERLSAFRWLCGRLHRRTRAGSPHPRGQFSDLSRMRSGDRIAER